MSDGLEDGSGEMAVKGFQLFAQFCSEHSDAEDLWEGRTRYHINDDGLLVSQSLNQSINRSNQTKPNQQINETNENR